MKMSVLELFVTAVADFGLDQPAVNCDIHTVDMIAPG
jgi:hypothetical protein